MKSQFIVRSHNSSKFRGTLVDSNTRPIPILINKQMNNKLFKIGLTMVNSQNESSNRSQKCNWPKNKFPNPRGPKAIPSPRLNLGHKKLSMSQKSTKVLPKNFKAKRTILNNLWVCAYLEFYIILTTFLFFRAKFRRQIQVES